MATKKSPTTKVAPKATKTVTTTSGKTKTMPAKKPARKPTKAKTTATSATTAPSPAVNKPKCGMCRIIACIIGAIAMIALVVIVIAALANNVRHKNEVSLVVKNGDGEKIETEYKKFNDGGFKIKIPKDFTELAQDELNDGSRPDDDIIAGYSSENSDATLLIVRNKSNTTSNDQIKSTLDNMKSVIESTSTTVISADTITKGDYNIGTMQISMGDGNYELYEKLAFFSQDEKLITIVFTTGMNDKTKWYPVSEFIFDSIEFLK